MAISRARLSDKVKCGNPDCGADLVRKDARGAIGGTLLCEECWPLAHEQRFATDPKIDQRPRLRCRRAGCRELFLAESNIGQTNKGYCSSACEIADIDPRLGGHY
jgi:hypothetical protein